MKLTPFTKNNKSDRREDRTIFLEVYNLEGYLVKKRRIGTEDPLPDNLNLAEGLYHLRLRQSIESLN